ncbi:MAG: hypothetical protein R3F59_05215 [Myxococcota bacterium]
MARAAKPNPLVRMLIAQRLLVSVPAVVLGTMWAVSRSAPAVTAAVAVAWGAVLLSAIAAWGLARGVHGDGQGDVLLLSGHGLRMSRWRTHFYAQQAEFGVLGGVALVLVVESLATGRPQGTLVTVVCTLVGMAAWLLSRSMRISDANLRCMHAITSGDLAAAEAALRRMERSPSQLLAAASMRSLIAWRRGDLDGALAALERIWSGTLDTIGGSIAGSLGRADAALAERWLAGGAVDQPGLTAQRHQLQARLALHSRRLGRRRGRGRGGPPVPLWHRQRLALIAAAADQAAGRTAAAVERLRAVGLEGLEVERSVSRTDPHVWRLVSDAVAGAPRRCRCPRQARRRPPSRR